MSNFEPNAILRGAQLTIIGAYRALQNPSFYKQDHYKQAILAIAAGIVIQLLLSIPVLFIRGSLHLTSLFVDLQRASWDDLIVETIEFLQHSVLQLPFFLMTLMKYVNPALDNMFMDSLAWVDQTYAQKHRFEPPDQLRQMYYENLTKYTDKNKAGMSKKSELYTRGLSAFLNRSGRKAGIAVSVYLLSFVPYIGKFVLPACSFYTLNKTVGPTPAIAIFTVGLALPKKALVIFLQTFFSSRSMMHELLEPYFSRIPFTREQKKAWYKEREGILFGFGVGFFLLAKLPYLGIFIYGIAEASTAFLITKMTDPPPRPEQSEGFAQSQLVWKNRKEFISMPLQKVDESFSSAEKTPGRSSPIVEHLPAKSFT